MIVTRQVQKPVDEVVDIICNMCGNSCKRGGCDYEGLTEVQVCGGYGSCLGDGKTYRFTICDSCLQTLFPLFKIPPETRDSDPWGESDVQQEEWQKEKK